MKRGQTIFWKDLYQQHAFSLIFSISDLPYFSHPSGCEMESHGGLNLHFSDGWYYWPYFHEHTDHLHVLFYEVFVQFLGQFLYWIVCFLIIDSKELFKYSSYIFFLSENREVCLRLREGWEVFNINEVQFITCVCFLSKKSFPILN